MKCYMCDDEIRGDQVYLGAKGTPLEGEILCEDCYYADEPCATVSYGKEDTPCIISKARNETEGDFRIRWFSTDPWRGCYVTSSEKYSLVNTAELLAYHESERMLKEFDERIRELFDEHGIEYARVFARTSNVFCHNYDLYVKRDQVLLAGLLVAKLKSEVDYDNPKLYRNIILDEDALRKLAELFPGRGIKTDFDAVELIEELSADGQDVLDELGKRMKGKEEKK